MGRASARHRLLVVVVWILAAGAIFSWGRTVGPSFVDDFRIPGAEAQRATDLLTSRSPSCAGATATIVFRARTGTVAEPAILGEIRAALSRVAALPHVAVVGDPVQPKPAYRRTAPSPSPRCATSRASPSSVGPPPTI